MGGFLVIPTLAQRVGDGFHGRMDFPRRVFAAPGYRDRFAYGAFSGNRRVYSGDYFAGHRYVGFAGIGLPDGWPVNSESGDSAVSVYPNPANTLPDYGSALCQSCAYDELLNSSVENPSPAIVIVYVGHDQTCPQVNGKPLYRIAIPDRPDRRGQMQLTYQNNLVVAHDYWYTEGSLNYVTMQEERIKTPINSFNWTLTLQLNRECGVDFQVPQSQDRPH
jgi:hypothetical protein